MLKHQVVCGWSNVKRGLLLTLGLLALSVALLGIRPPHWPVLV